MWWFQFIIRLFDYDYSCIKYVNRFKIQMLLINQVYDDNWYVYENVVL